MPKNITIKVTATDEGSLKKLIAQLKAAGHEVDAVTTAHKRAGAASDDHFHRQAKGIAGVANGTKSFSKMAASINGDNNSLVGAYAALAANIFAVTAAFNALKNAAEIEQVMRGLEASGNRVGLTYANTTQRVREAGAGLLSLGQSARSTAQVLAAGFKADQVVRITEAAKDASFALGRDMTESMDRLTRGVIKLEPELLDELGIMVRIDEASSAYARTINKTATQLTAAEKRQGFFNATLAEAELKFGGIADAAGGASGLAKLSATFSDLTNTIFKFLNLAAGPLAAMFSKSPVALVGGLLLFASSIKGQLMPGLVDMGDKLASVSKKASELASTQALASIQSTNWGKKGSDAAKEYFATVEAGTHTMEGAKASLDRVQSARPLGFWKNIQTEEVRAIKEIASAQATAAALQHQSNAVTLASTGNLKSAFKELNTSIKTYAAGTSFASSGTGVLAASMNAAKIGAYAFGASMKVVGVTLLTLLPWLGLISLAVGALWAGWKKLEEVLIGKEVLAARKELDVVMKSLIDKEKEYARIKASSASQAAKEVALNVLVSNSINEQVAAIEKLMAAEKARKFLKQNPEIKKERINAQNLNVGGTVAEQKIKKLLIDNYFSSVDETREATRALVGDTTALHAILLSSGPEKAAAKMNALRDALGGVGDASTELQTAFKELDKATQDFIKSATPNTPFDGLSTALNKTVVALQTARIEYAKSGKSAEDFSKIISAIGPESQQLLTVDTAKLTSNYKEASAVVSELGPKLQKLSQEQATQYYDAQRAVALSENKLIIVEKELGIRNEQILALQQESILGAALIQQAQARVSKLNSFTALSGVDVKRRMQAENAVLGAQAKQILLQVELLKIILASAEARKKEAEAIRDSSVELINMNDLQIQLQKSQELSSINANPRATEEAKKKATDEYEAAKKVVAENENIARLKAGMAAAQISAGAILSGQTSKAVQDAEAAATQAQADLDRHKLKIQLIEEDNLELMNEFKIRKALGSIENEAYIKARNYATTILGIKREELKLEKESTIKALEAQKARALAAGAVGTATELEARISLLNQIYDQKLVNLDLDSRANILESLGLKTLVDRLELTKKYTDILLNQAELIASNISAEAELAVLKRKTAVELSGRSLTPTEERKMAFEIAEANLDVALAVEKMKELTIHAEYALLKAQYNLEAMKLKNANVILRDELASPNAIYTDSERAGIQNTIDAQTDAISAYEQAIGNLSLVQQAALRAVGLNIESLREAVKASGLKGRLSGGATDPGASLAALGTTDEMGNRTSNIGFNKETFSALNEDLSPFIEQLKKLGPDGEYVSAFVEGALVITDAVSKIADAFGSFSEGMKFEDMMTNAKSVFEGISSIIGQIASITKASSDAKIANIDREISAEQNRDGKSEASLARIKSMEAKKDAIARKSFETNKKLMMAQAIMATAAGVAGALAHMELFPFNIALAGIIGAMGAAQLAIIAGTSYQSSASSSAATASPSSVSVGSRGNSIDLARNNVNAGGEAGYLTGAQGQGTSASNFRRRAYGGYGHAGMIVGEKGPELFVPSTPGYVTSNDNVQQPAPVNATFHINAIDAAGVEEVLTGQRGHIIGMIREAANANGQSFLESVNTAKYRRGGNKL